MLGNGDNQNDKFQNKYSYENLEFSKEMGFNLQLFNNKVVLYTSETFHHWFLIIEIIDRYKKKYTRINLYGFPRWSSSHESVHKREKPNIVVILLLIMEWIMLPSVN